MDDIIITSDHMKHIDDVKAAIGSKFKTTDLNQASFVLGIKLDKQEDGTWMLHQRQYIDEIMKLYSVNNLKKVDIPLQPNLGLTTKLEGEDEALRQPIDTTIYRQAIGKLMYLTMCTRPDLSFSVSLLSRFVSAPKEKHWRCVMTLFKYIKSTRDHILTYPSQGTVKLTGYSDSDHAGNLDDRKSTSGYVFMVGGCCVSWRSSKQQTVSISSTEAEYVALSTCAQEALWLRSLLSELGHAQNTTTIYNDNLSSHHIVKGSTSARSKHIDVRHHFIRDHVVKKELEIQYMDTNELPADVFTKAVNKQKHNQCIIKLNLIGV